jgi:hypothetical protein
VHDAPREEQRDRNMRVHLGVLAACHQDEKELPLALLRNMCIHFAFSKFQVSIGIPCPFGLFIILMTYYIWEHQVGTVLCSSTSPSKYRA